MDACGQMLADAWAGESGHAWACGLHAPGLKFLLLYSNTINIFKVSHVVCVNISTDGSLNYASGDNNSLKSAAISQEASGITHNPNTHSLAIGSIRKSSLCSIRKSSQSQGTYVCAYLVLASWVAIAILQ